MWLTACCDGKSAEALRDEVTVPAVEGSKCYGVDSGVSAVLSVIREEGSSSVDTACGSGSDLTDYCSCSADVVDSVVGGIPERLSVVAEWVDVTSSAGLNLCYD